VSHATYDATVIGDAAEARLSSVAATVAEHVVELGDDVGARILETIPELRADELVVDLLGSSVMENVSRLLHRFRHRFEQEPVEAPVAAVEYARRLAQRGITVIALVRAYRIGHARYLYWCLEELIRQEPDREIVSQTTQLMLTMSFDYIDGVSEQVVAAYQHERDRWLLSQTAVRAARVAALLAGSGHDDVDAAEAALGYRLRQHHLALLAWTGEPTENGAALIRLDRLVAAAAVDLECAGRPLFVPRDEALAWAWLPLGGRAEVLLPRLAQTVATLDPTVRIAVGSPARGLEGFRRSHQQAVGVQTAALAARPGRSVTTFADAGPLAFMCHDMDGTRSWVQGVLGGLAVDDEAHLRLRDTVREFLGTGGSYSATGQRLGVHKNTVQYRLRRAEELRGRPLTADAADLDLAVRACQQLGAAVLLPAATP
jgi:DNA-binding PucR family transcriptional regulator